MHFSHAIHFNYIAYNGKCTVKKGFDNYNKYKKYCSDIPINPTYKDLIIISNDFVEYAECWDRRFFEGVAIIGLIPDNIMEIDLSLGN